MAATTCARMFNSAPRPLLTETSADSFPILRISASSRTMATRAWWWNDAVDIVIVVVDLMLMMLMLMILMMMLLLLLLLMMMMMLMLMLMLLLLLLLLLLLMMMMLMVTGMMACSDVD